MTRDNETGQNSCPQSNDGTQEMPKYLIHKSGSNVRCHSNNARDSTRGARIDTSDGIFGSITFSRSSATLMFTQTPYYVRSTIFGEKGFKIEGKEAG